MNAARWEQIQELFHRVADMPAEKRNALLDTECGADGELRDEVAALLASDERGAPVLDGGVAQSAGAVLRGAHPAFRGFGPYRILRLIGEGGMGVVYLAERADLGNQVAIKVLRDAYLSTVRRERFAAEQKTLAQLNHPNIARLYDADTLPDGTPWFVMEYVDGVPLTRFAEEQHLTPAARLQLLRAVCGAVEHAHAHAVIHRDLKPSNILAERDGTVKLLDFGIAKQLDAVDHTVTGLRLMTPAYASPEQVRGEASTVRTDVYSLGVILYELLSGRPPFDLATRTPGEAERIILFDDPPKPSSLVAQTGAAGASALGKTAWGDLDVLCLHAMHKEPERRYPSVEALTRDVDHFLLGEPLEARRDSLSYRLGKFVRRKRRPLVAAAAVSLAMVGLIIFFLIRLASARDAALEEVARTQRIQQFLSNLLQGGDADSGPSNDLRVVTLVDRGAERARALDRDPKVQSELFLSLGQSYRSLKQFAKADSLLEEALRERRAVYGGDSAEVAETLAAIGLLRKDEAHFDEAESDLREAIAIDRRRLLPVDERLMHAMASLGEVLYHRGRYEEAASLLADTIRLQKAARVPEADLDVSVTDLANTYYYMGRYAEAEALNREMLAHDLKHFGRVNPGISADLINLAYIEKQWHHYREAEQNAREALAIDETWYRQENDETASAMTVLAQVLRGEGKLVEAGSLLEQALRTEERAHSGNHPRIALAVIELGQVRLAEGRLEEAEARFRRAEAMYRAVNGDGHSYVAAARSALAAVYFQRKDYREAERIYRETVSRYNSAFSPLHFDTGLAHMKLGRTLLREGNAHEAETELREGRRILAAQKPPAAEEIAEIDKDLTACHRALGEKSEEVLRR